MHNVHGANALHLYPQASYWDWPYTADKLADGKREYQGLRLDMVQNLGTLCMELSSGPFIRSGILGQAVGRFLWARLPKPEIF